LLFVELGIKVGQAEVLQYFFDMDFFLDPLLANFVAVPIRLKPRGFGTSRFVVDAYSVRVRVPSKGGEAVATVGGNFTVDLVFEVRNFAG
jgi:hypothetical protein